MNRTLALLLLLAAAGSPASAQREHEGHGGWGWGKKGAGSVASPVVIKMRRQMVPRPTSIHPNSVIRDNRRITVPTTYAGGVKIVKTQGTAPPQHVTIVRNPQVTQSITVQQRVEIVPNRFYWHTVAGVRYAHYYDGGVHWYGFYHGPQFYWTRWNAGYWWWYDPIWFRWVYWYDGYWWWPGPGGVAFVYVDNAYYPYEENGVVVKQPEVHAPPAEVPPARPGASEVSADGSRMVQITPDGEAFLYDKSGPEPAFMKYLGKGVAKARFSGGKNGAPLQILLDFKDGTFALFDKDGGPRDAAPEPAAAPGSQQGLPSGIPPPPSTPPSPPGP